MTWERLRNEVDYQEGPGFLFIATQGGRPPESVAGQGAAAVVRRRRRALRRWQEGDPEPPSRATEEIAHQS